ncbi:MAG: ABC transporter substrate-binding protein, partial [Blastocatellia bacterium]|nr:ABC transporter substrate-binding protein [Blastocatellia bacterium]
MMCAVIFAACGGAPAGNLTAARTVTDGLGREVGLPAEVRRAVSLAPSITEIVFAAGAGDRLVGVTSFCDHPAEIVDIAKVGDTQSPNVEAIVALEPDVVFVSTASQLQAFTDVLEGRNIAVV